jgi:hypothetical protein
LNPRTALATLLAAALVCAGSQTHAAAPAAATGAGLSGEVLEVRQVDAYTYLRLKTASGETWAAVPTAAVKAGAKVTIAQPMVMRNFESKSLKRRFDEITFGTLDAPTGPAGSSVLKGAPSMAAAPAAAPPLAKVDKAKGPNGRTVGEVYTGKAGLKDRTVVVRGRVVKFSAGIMGKNWVHLRDGSGQAADGSHDLLVTTQDTVAVGDVVDATGKLRTDVDLGSGYTYAVMLVGATLRK